MAVLGYPLQGAYLKDFCVIDPHKFIGIGTVRRCDFFRVDVALLEDVCHSGGRL